MRTLIRFSLTIPQGGITSKVQAYYIKKTVFYHSTSIILIDTILIQLIQNNMFFMKKSVQLFTISRLQYA